MLEQILCSSSNDIEAIKADLIKEGVLQASKATIPMWMIHYTVYGLTSRVVEAFKKYCIKESISSNELVKMMVLPIETDVNLYNSDAEINTMAWRTILDTYIRFWLNSDKKK